MDKEFEIRKEKIFKFLKNHKDWIQYILLFIILSLAVYIRIQNLELLKDVTTGEYISLELDSTLFLRYAQYIVDHGKLFTLDTMRNFPVGADISGIGIFTSYFVAYLYKFLHIFISSITIQYVDIIYPIFATVIGSIFLFLLVRRLFDYRVGLLSVLFLVTAPTFLFRSISSDHDILGLMFIFMTLYFFIVGWHCKKIKNNIIFGLLAAFTSVLAYSTAGNVRIFFVMLALFTLFHVTLDSVKKSDLYVYPVWYLGTFITLIILGRIDFKFLLLDYGVALPATLAFFSLIVYIIFKNKNISNYLSSNKFISKIPRGFLVLFLVFFIGFLFLLIFFGFSLISYIISSFMTLFSSGLYVNRWASTVAENKRVFVDDWIGNFGLILFWSFIIGLVLLIYNLFKDIKDGKNLFYVYSVCILAFIFSKYSQNSILNGLSTLSKFLFFGSILIMIIYTLYYYFTNYYQYKEQGKHFTMDLNWRYTFLLIIALVNVIIGTTAIRLFFELAPFVVIFSSFTFIFILDYFLSLKLKYVNYIAVLFLFLFLFSPFSFAKGIVYTDAVNSYNSVKFSGPGYNQQWQVAGKWVRDNTPKGAVFNHWWDYGYWVQSGFERPTVTDGGNLFGWWNYLTGRHVLTTPNDETAMKFFYAHNVSYLLIVSDEIGKYPAYSLIGSDKSLDRYSFVNFMGLNPTLTKDTRNGTLLVYTGNYPLDEDLILQGKIYPKGTPILGVVLPAQPIYNDKSEVIGNNIMQPMIILGTQDGQIQLRMKCVYIDRLYNFESYDYGGCIRIIPNIQNGQVSNVGALVFLSKRVADSLFGRYYLLEEKNKNIELVYTDEKSFPLAIYNGRGIGPIKIWKINYSKGFSVNKTEYDYFTSTGYLDYGAV